MAFSVSPEGIFTDNMQQKTEIMCDKLREDEEHSHAHSFCATCLDYLCKTCDVNHQLTFPNHKVIYKNLNRGRELIKRIKGANLLRQEITKVQFQTIKNQERVELYRNFAIEKIKAERAKINQALDEQKAQINAQFDDLEENVFRHVVDTYASDSDKLATNLSDTDALQIQIDDLNRDLKDSDLLDDENLQQPLAFTKAVTTEREVWANLRKLVTGQRNEITRYRFEPNWSLPAHQVIVTDFGKLVTTATRNEKIQSNLMSEISVESTEDRDFNWIKGLCLFSDKLLIVADAQNCSIKVLDVTTNQILDICSLPTRPSNITKVKKDEIAVTLPNHKIIQFLKVSQTGSLTMVQQIPVSGTCRGIACYKKQLIVSFDFPESQIQIMNMEGEVKNVFNSEQTADNTGRNSSYAGIALSPDQKHLYVIDEDHESVIQMTLNGKVTSRYIDKTLKKPHGIAVAQTGVVFVCGQGKVHIISKDLKDGRVLLESKHGLSGVQALAYCSTQQKLYIGMRNKSIKVFSLDTTSDEQTIYSRT